MDNEVKKTKSSPVAVVVLVLCIIALGGYFVYNQFIKDTDENVNDKQSESTPAKQENNDAYTASQYVKVSDVDLKSMCSDCTGSMKKIEFKYLPESLTSNFISKHKEYLELPKDTRDRIETGKSSFISFNNTVSYEVDNNRLSVYEKEDMVLRNPMVDDGKRANYYSININLDTKTEITNEELLNIYGIKKTSLYEKILTNIANTVTADKFLLSTTGDVTAESISIAKFKENISTYAAKINDANKLTLYVKDKKVYAVYKQSEILELLGMGSHMGVGLVSLPQEVQAN